MNTPPKWATRFLTWYCNPDLLEEIEGDVNELYRERMKHQGVAAANRSYIWDVMRFCRWSNIRREPDRHRPGYFGILWNLNFKIALRNAFRNKLIFSVKMGALSVCLAFALLVSAFVIHEFTFDRHERDHARIFRAGTSVNIEGGVTRYAVSPVAMADGLAEAIPEVESACWIMYNGRPAFTIEEKVFDNATALLASSDFLRVFSFDFVSGTVDALDDPNKIVLTASTAKTFFGDADAVGHTMAMGWTDLEVGAVIKDLPANTHLQFDALISEGSYSINDGWDNVNAYTYFKLKEGAVMNAVEEKVQAVLLDHRENMQAGRDYWTGDNISIAPIIENLSSIHLSESLDEDIALKGNSSNIYILVVVVILFFITGLINFLNLSLAELTTNLKKISILQVFGGATAGHNKVVFTNTLLSIMIVLPVTVLLGYGGLLLAEHWFSIYIDGSVFRNPALWAVAAGFLAIFVFSSKVNAFVLTRCGSIIHSLKGQLSQHQGGFRMRGVLVSVQLSFSIIMIALIVVIVDQFRFIASADKGFEDRNTIVVKMRDTDFTAAEGFMTAVRNLVGVKNADASSFYLDNIETKEIFEVVTSGGAKKMLVAYMNCGYDYLATVNIMLLRGRNFQRHHNDNRGAYIINETAARQFGWKDPVGQQISGPLGTDRGAGQVIGVVKDFNFASLHSRIEPIIIFLGNEDWGVRYVYIKVDALRPGDLITRIENEYKSAYPHLPFDWEYLDAKFSGLYRKDHEIGNMFRVGLVISVLISCLGIFSLSALLVVMRAREMGIRKVVGAGTFQLFMLHIGHFLRFLVIAMVVACPCIYFFSQHWLANFAYHIDLHAGYFIIPCLAALLIIFLTVAFHGISSAKVKPVDVLKHE